MANDNAHPISDSLSNLAQVMRLLEKNGLTEDDFQVLVNNWQLCQRIVKMIKQASPRQFEPMDLPKRIGPLKVIEFLRDVFTTEETQQKLVQWAHDLTMDGQDGFSTVLHELMRPLNERQRTVLIMYYGLKDGRSYTQTELSEHFGLSAGRVSQILNKACRTVMRTGLKLAEPPKPAPVWDDWLPIAELELSERARNLLGRDNIVTIGDLTSKSEADIMAIRLMGNRDLAEIKHALAEGGRKLKE